MKGNTTAILDDVSMLHVARGLRLPKSKPVREVHMRPGQRCRAVRNITGHQGLIRACTNGTIKGVIENLGRRLIGVQWDGSFQMYVFPHEIELISCETEKDLAFCM